MENVKRTAKNIENLSETIKVLKLATKIKYVIKGKPSGRLFSVGGLCYVEPTDICVPAQKKDLKIVGIAKLDKKPVYEFVYNHAPEGYKGIFRGPVLKDCMLAIAKELAGTGILKNGVAFSVKEMSGHSVFDDDVPVKISVYSVENGVLPQNVSQQDVIYSGKSYSKQDIKQLELFKNAKTKLASRKTSTEKTK